jgi:dolichol-phosphate mannosyltransferase
MESRLFTVQVKGRVEVGIGLSGKAHPAHTTPNGKGHSPTGSYQLSLVLVSGGGECLTEAVREAKSALQALAGDYEILVVTNDASADPPGGDETTGSRVRVIRPSLPGYGAALSAGLAAARCDLVAFTGADGTLNRGDLEDLLPLTRHNHVVRAARTDAPVPYRLVDSLAGLLLGNRVPDPDGALTVVRREHLPALLPESEGSFAGTELVTNARLGGLSVAEVAVHNRPRSPRRATAPWRGALRALCALLPWWWSRLLFPASPPPSRQGNRPWLALAVLALVAGILLFPNLNYALVEPDEGRYAEIGREMLVSGDWVVPMVNQVPYCDKPPLLYWLVASSYAVLGVSEGAARLVPTLATLGTILLTFLFGRRALGQRPAFLAALALTLMPGIVPLGRFLFLDSLLSLWVTAALFTAHAALQGSRVRWSWWSLSAACSALGILTKGPIALVLIIPPVAAYAWLAQVPGRPRLRHWAAYVGLALAMAAPWFVAVMSREPDFARYFLVEHHLNRFFGREYHSQPFWYYLPVMLVGGLPWSLLTIPVFRFVYSRSAAMRAQRPQALGFFLLWGTWVVLLFSLSRGKLPPYILPAAPAMALLIGCFLDRTLFREAPAALWRQACATASRVGMSILACVWLGVLSWAWLLRLFAPAVVLTQAGLCVAVIAGSVLLGRRLTAKTSWLLCGTLVAALIVGLAHFVVPAWSARRSPLAHAEVVRRLAHDGRTAAACYGGDFASVPFYFESCEAVPIFGGEGAPEQIRAFLQEHPRCLFIVRHREDRDAFWAAVPDGLTVTTVTDVGEAMAVLVTPAP